MWKSIKAFFTRDLRFKITALTCAAIILAMLTISRMTSRTIRRIPITVDKIPPNMRLVDFTPEAVDLTIRGPKELLDTLERPRIEIGLGDVTSATKSIQLDRDHVFFELNEQDRKLIQIDRSDLAHNRIRFMLERREREVPVAVPQLIGKPAPPFYVDPSLVTITPATVRVTGSDKALEEAQQKGIPLETSRIEIADYSQPTWERNYWIDFASVNVAPLREEDRKALVRIQLDRSDAEQRMQVRSVRVVGLPEGMEATTNPADVWVTFRGREVNLKQIDISRIRAVANAEGIPSPTGTIEMPYEVKIPPNFDVQVAAMDPPTVQVNIVRAEDRP